MLYHHFITNKPVLLKTLGWRHKNTQFKTRKSKLNFGELIKNKIIKKKQKQNWNVSW